MKKSLIKIILIILFAIAVISVITITANAKTIEGYQVKDYTVYGVSPTTVYSEFIEILQPDIGCDTTVALYTAKDGVYNKVEDGLIKTGMFLLTDKTDIELFDEYIQNNGKIDDNYNIINKPYQISVLGDLNGDGIHDQIDLSATIRHIIGLSNFVIKDDLALKAADLNGDGTVSLVDLSSSITKIVMGVTPKLVTSRQNYNITLSETSGTTTYPTTKAFTVTNPSGGEITAKSKDESIAVASVSNNTITVTPKKAGTVEIVVASAATETKTASSTIYTITINKAEGCLVLNKNDEERVSEGFTTTLKITEHHEGGKISAVSYDNNIARVEVNSDQVIIYGISTGITSVVVKCEATDCYESKTENIRIYVNKPKYYVKDGQVIDDVFKNFSIDPNYNYLGASYIRFTGNSNKWKFACPDPSQISDTAGKTSGGTLAYRTSASCDPGEYNVHAVMKVTANLHDSDDIAIDIFCSFAGAGIMYSYDISENVTYACVDKKVTIDENNANEPLVRLGARVEPNCSVDLEILDFYIYN